MWLGGLGHWVAKTPGLRAFGSSWSLYSGWAIASQRALPRATALEP